MTAPHLGTSEAQSLIHDDEAFTKAFMGGVDQPPADPVKAEEPAKPSEPEAEPTPETPAAEAGEQTSGAEEPKAEEPKVEGEPEKEPEPEKPPLTKFAVFDEQGELEVPNLTFAFKANGKDYNEVPLEKVVLLAQMGIGAQARLEDAKRIVTESQSKAADLETRMADADQRIRDYDQYMARLADDPEFYERFREQYAKTNSPEARAERAEREVQDIRTQTQVQRDDNTRAAFVQQVLVPRVDTLLKQYPTITQEELVGRYSMLTAPLQVRGVVPVNRLTEVQRVVEADLAEWAQSTHAVRDLEKRKTTEAAEKRVKAEQQKTTQAKRQLARAVAPAPGSTSAPVVERPKPKDFKSAQDFVDNLDEFLAAAAQGSS